MSLIKRKGNECVENLHGKWVGRSAHGSYGNLGEGGSKKVKFINSEKITKILKKSPNCFELTK